MNIYCPFCFHIDQSWRDWHKTTCPGCFLWYSNVGKADTRHSKNGLSIRRRFTKTWLDFSYLGTKYRFIASTPCSYAPQLCAKPKKYHPESVIQIYRLPMYKRDNLLYEWTISEFAAKLRNVTEVRNFCVKMIKLTTFF